MPNFTNLKFFKTLFIVSAFISASAAVIINAPAAWLKEIKQEVYALFEEDFDFVAAPGKVIYVDIAASGNDDGSSWINAFTDLQDALQSSLACDTIKVAQGTYYPDRGTDDRDSTFFVSDSTILLGGYEGLSGDTLAQRDWVCNTTFLSGDIGDPDDNTDNSYHVVTTLNTGTQTLVDGFIITDGNADGGDEQTWRGGGWYNLAELSGVSSPNIRNCIFETNFALTGGGLANIASNGVANPSISNSIFRGNTGGLNFNGGGAGIFNLNSGGTANLLVVNSIFSGNFTEGNGSGILMAPDVDSVHLSLINSVFAGNNYSSAISHLLQDMGPTAGTDIVNCIFYNNDNELGYYNDITEFRVKNSILSELDDFIDLGGNKYAVNPQFVQPIPPYVAPSAYGDFHLLPNSPALNMGSNADAPALDLEGNPRPSNGIVEIGPYEYRDTSCTQFAQHIFVDSSVMVSGDGLSWATAFKTVTEALNISHFCDQIDTIHVARGTYFPLTYYEILDPCTGMLIELIDNGRSGSFDIPSGLVVLGGYEGLLGDTLAPRNWVCNKTILSGNIGDPEESTDNSYHVVTTVNVDSTTVVDGFCIIDGYADGSFNDDNKAGGWFNFGSGVNNRSNPTIRNCILANNYSIDHGGFMYNLGSDGGNASPTLINCKIIDNTSGQDGGGLYNDGDLGKSSPVLINCIISGNESEVSRGGAMNNNGEEGESSPVLINCIISGNYAGQQGGGLYNNGSEGTSSPVLTNCIIYGNVSNDYGGGLYNNAYTDENVGTSSPILTNCIIGNNLATIAGGDFYNNPDNNGIVVPVVSYSIIEGDYSSLNAGCSDCVDTIMGGNKFEAEPQFKEPFPAFIAPYSGGDFHVLATSVAINMGLNMANNWPTDLGGDDRIQAGTIDIGPYEFLIPSCVSFENILYVDASVDSLNTGNDWAHALNDLQLALLIANFCDIDTIKVAQGTYYPVDSTSIVDACGNLIEDLSNDRTVSFNIPNGVVVMGGYPIGGGSEDERDWNCNKTILCGDIGVPGEPSDNTYHVVITQNVDSTTVIDGFCIRDGYADDEFDNEGSESGGGWLNFGYNGGYSNPTIINCAIIENYSSLYGGGMANIGNEDGNASPTLINCILAGNETEERGGGIYNDGDDDGNASPVLINCILSGNHQSDENEDDYGGGAVYNDADDGTSSPVFINCVISGNRAYQGGAIFNFPDDDGICNPVITNCILWNNDAVAGSVFYNHNGGIPRVYYSILQNNNFNDITAGDPITDENNNKFEGSGVDPNFIIAPEAFDAPISAGNFNILPGSDAIDMGLDSANTYPVDFAGNQRIQNDSVDIGAYEFQPLDCNSFVTGLVYVDSSAVGNNTGLSWADAFTDLQDALEAARYCNVDTIRVAQGTYYPFQYIIINECGVPDTLSEVDRTVSFDIPDSTVVLGGYPAGGGSDDERDWTCNKTILCGDIGIPGDSSDNSYHVVTTFDVDSVTVVDGFCIRDGFADFPGHPANSGGGWFNRSFQDGYSNPRILNCTFINNEAISDGGALYNDGGGSGNSSPYLFNCEFYENNASYGGAIYNYGGYSGISSPTIINTIISGNQANVQGGGMLNNGGQAGNANPLIVNCIFSGNASMQDGGAMFNHTDNDGFCSPVVINTTFSGNLAVMNGGAILSEAEQPSVSDPVFYNCIFWNNISSNGPVFFNVFSQPSVSYSIIQDGGMSNDINDATVTLGNAPTIDVEGNKFNTDPLFVFAPAGLLAPNTSGDFHFAFTSPAIDMGTNILNSEPFDLDGNVRIQGDSIDIGPYEISLPECGDYGNVIYVDISAAPGGNGSTWDSAFTNLQDALTLVNYCNVDTIYVAQGTYYPYQPFNSSSCSAPVVSSLGPREATFNIPDSTVLLGGFPSGGGGLDTRDWTCNKTILCGDIGIPGDSSDNSYHVVTTLNVDSVTLVDGFCIQDGLADGAEDSPDQKGAGWYNASDSGFYSNPLILNCTFINNTSAFRGGGMYNFGVDSGNASPKLINCYFISNHSNAGGAIYNQGDSGKSSPYILNTIFTGNSAGSEFANGSGGAMRNQGRDGGESNPVIINCIFSGNWASFAGGALYNDADGPGGNCSPYIINTTFNGNRAEGDGEGEGGVMANRGDNIIIPNGICAPVMINCIFWNNIASISGPVFYNSDASPSVSYSILQGGGGIEDINDGSITGNDLTTIDGLNNKFDEDPLFIIAPPGSAAPTTAGNFHVMFNSPAIDMGLDSVNNQPFDLDGAPRIQNDSIDIGPYETVVPDCNLYMAGVVYVDSAAAPGGNGRTWDSAFTDLQDALTVAAFCGVDSIFVAQGTYYPSQTIINNSCPNQLPDTVEADRNASFIIPESTVMLGGFPLGGGTLEERNWICNKTILCGEIQQDGDSSNNSYTIVKTINAGEEVLVDGFCIRDAVDNEDEGLNQGGGWYNAAIGTVPGDGSNFSSPLIRNCVFINNFAGLGGAFFNYAAEGGEATAQFVNCQFRGNTAFRGGAIMNYAFDNGRAYANFINSILSGNGLLFDNGSGAAIRNEIDGGEDCAVNLTNSAICGNLGLEGDPEVQAAVWNNNTVNIYNSIFWNNTASIYNDEGGTDIFYSIMQDDGFDDANTSDIIGNKDVDPLFIDAPPAGIFTHGDYHVLLTSPAINMGDDGYNMEDLDLDQAPRIQQGVIDIGPYEFTPPDCGLVGNIIYVDSSAVPGGNGHTWDSAFTSLSEALLIASFCSGVDTILVARGTYYPGDTLFIRDPCTGDIVDTVIPDRSATFNIPDGVVVMGGFPSGGGSYEERNWICNETVLCGDLGTPGDSTDNSYHVVTTINADTTTTIDGFIVRDGNASGGPVSFGTDGGGWINIANTDSSSSPTILNTVICNNHAFFTGGGFANLPQQGGSFTAECRPLLINCAIQGNTALNGGGLANSGFFGLSSLEMINCIVSGNRASAFGGGIFNYASDGESYATLTNCVISGNAAVSGGGTGNSAFGDNDICEVSHVNTIYWNNVAVSGPAFLNLDAICSFQNSIIQPDNTEMFDDDGNNFFENPQFISAPEGDEAPTCEGDFHLKYFSIGVNKGYNAANDEYPVDPDRNQRIQNGTIDIGAYEFEGPDCSLYTDNVVYVDSTATGANNGTSWTDAFNHVQDALIVAEFCVDTVKVAQGTYYPSYPDTIVRCGSMTIIPISQEDFFFIPDSTIVLGGYPTGGSEEAWRMPHCNLTIMSGDIDQNGDTSGNSYNVVKTRDYNDTIVYDGFVIEQGNAIPVGEEGAGWWDGSDSSSGVLCIRNTIFRDNYAVDGGGFYGQGIRDLKIIASEWYNNHAISISGPYGLGGGVYLERPSVGDPGDTANIRFENVLFHHNTASNGGGAIAVGNGPISLFSMHLINATLSQNLPDGFYIDGERVQVWNSIVWNNGAAPFSGAVSPTILYSIVNGITEVDGNKAQDPLFQSPTSNFHLSQGSPAIDMGENSFSTESTDLDGLPRIMRTIIDIGAYENLLYCFDDTIFVNADGTIPFNLEDSIFKAPIPPGFEVTINGGDTSAFDLTCSNLGPNSFHIQLLRSCDLFLIDSCTMNITLADTFAKNLVCNNKLNVSLETGCIKLVTPDDVLENISGCTQGFYDVQLFYPFGTHKFPPANDLLDESHIGYTMVYNVFETSTGNSCWGYLKVEDKMPPLLNCADDTIACYELPTLPLIASNEDDCYEGKVELISDEWFDYGCDSVLSGYVIRTIQGTDRWGNFRRCESRISIERTLIDSLECPDMVELPCEIRTQIGGGKTLKTPITVDQSKVTPAYLLSLQKKTWEFTDNTKDWILNPSVQVVPQIDGQNLWPGAGGICKINSLYKDSRLDICGTGFKIHREWTIVDWCTLEERTCIQYISVEDTIAPVILEDITDLYYNASAHDCVASVTIPALVAGKDFRDCNMVEQTYILQYVDRGHPGKIVVLTGSLPSKPLLLPTDSINVTITLTDKCNNRSTTSRNIFIYDITPPTPVCDEFTQVTVDPVNCWARIAAKDLDNGSRDNCCDILHFAAAHMDSITYWRNYWITRLETKVGKEAFWRDKATYDLMIEDWINCYVFSDSIRLTECGTAQVVLRVYEACGVPRVDPHIWPCSEHAWFCYNTYLYIADFNFNWFDDKGPHSCAYRPELTSIATQDSIYAEYKIKGYLEPKFEGAAQFIYCNAPFYFPTLGNSNGGEQAPGLYCAFRQYSDCMINVLVDDKQAPVVAELEDVLVYCDRAPDYASSPDCVGEGREIFSSWPGLLKDSKGVEHGYYGGSDFLGIHLDEHEIADACGYDNAHFWAPIYCRSWLYVDSFDTAGQIDPKQYFETLVLFDKTRPARTLLAKEFSISDNCRLNDTTLNVTDEGSLNGCGEGWIQRTWTIRDKCDNPITVRQKVVVKHRSDFEVIFPEDKIVECDFLNTTDPEDAGTPIISDDECEQVGVQYKDEVFTVEDSACYKIVRTWTLIDWCIYNPNAQHHYSDVIVDDRLRADTGNRSCVYRHLKDNNDGYMKYIQVIKVIDKVAPVVTTRDTTICIYGEDCKSSLVRIPFSGTDNCTAASELSYRVEVDLNATDGVFTNRTYAKTSIDLSTQSNPTEFVYSPAVAGKHIVHVIVKDNCGNEDTSSYRFELKDCKKPTPYCYNGIATVIMPSTGKITVWAKDLDAGSFDNCTLAANLKFSFSANANESSKEYSCTDIPDGKSRTIPVEIWVTDEAGNQDHCTTYILLQDNSGNACPDVAGLSVTIAGTIQTETKEPVEHVRVNIYGGPVQMNYQTGVKGTYHFEGLPSKSNYSIKSSRDDQPMNGISTLDLVLIQKHILGIELLDSPYKILAADIDNDKQITAIDLVELRKLILATYEDLPNNESWRFIPKSTTFNDPQNPWNAGAVSEVMEMKEVTTDYKSGDFIGIKVGDVNASVTPHSLMGVEVRGNENGLIFEINDQVFKRGDVVRVDFRSPNFRGISGWQGTLNVSDQLSVVSGQLEPGVLNLTNQNLGVRYAKEGKITMSWNTNAKSGLDIDDKQVLFTLVFKAQENGRLSEVLRIGSQHTIAESYEGKGELGNLSIRFVQNGNEIVAKSALYQNYPNPFDQRTVIGINLAAQGKGTLKVYDATGRTIKSVERDWTKGYHEVWFDRKEIGATGVLYYRFESGFFNASRKMILID